MTAADKKFWAEWETFRDNMYKATPVDLNETPLEKRKRIAKLEANPEQWFKFYLPNFYTSEAAPFHIAATKRVLANPEWYEVRSWARELSKSGRTMMEVLYLVLTGKKKNILMVSSTYDAAVRLLLPYKTILELNDRIINDYGVQQTIGSWEAGEFKTKGGAAFRALGAGQSPRGTRNDAFRPDVILIDDIDTDEECRNKERIKIKIKWIEEALIPTRSISNPLMIIVCGNIIAKYCCVTELANKADKHDVINIIDKFGNSTWAKNTPEMIARIRKTVSSNAFQKEYMNNPIIEGGTFKEITYGKPPKINRCDMVVAYSDPSTSDKNGGVKSAASHKSIVIVGFKNYQYFVYWLRVDQINNSGFVDWLFEAEDYLDRHDVDPKKIYIENNSLQDPFYTQVIQPLIKTRTKERKRNDRPPITPDRRKKPDKFFRIDGTLEPINREGNLIFSEELKNSPHMTRMEEQMLAVNETSKTMDGPDALEGAVWKIQKRSTKEDSDYASEQRADRHH
ncbi:hypothetical protein [Mucilaginibacter glaciei]|uniref:Phage terminase large subunit-like protein n=1 Tax=Mucilaginibacter glaciei TaxID=2772109 RepID=A0A926S3I1_9SPHI|nr:hypothetical protein [Mucilaginibacter glaciei]MBD1394269.1 hypothetical protein [Mucilaginibacter glaciei]